MGNIYRARMYNLETLRFKDMIICDGELIDLEKMNKIYPEARELLNRETCLDAPKSMCDPDHPFGIFRHYHKKNDEDTTGWYEEDTICPVFLDEFYEDECEAVNICVGADILKPRYDYRDHFSENAEHIQKYGCLKGIIEEFSYHKRLGRIPARPYIPFLGIGPYAYDIDPVSVVLGKIRSEGSVIGALEAAVIMDAEFSSHPSDTCKFVFLHGSPYNSDDKKTPEKIIAGIFDDFLRQERGYSYIGYTPGMVIDYSDMMDDIKAYMTEALKEYDFTLEFTS